MGYIVSARKYRPQSFEDVVGQQHVTTTLKNALISDKLAHAFLFCGPRGVGKTTCARLLAKVINMPDPKKAIEDGSYAEVEIDISLNIFELDGASNNGVENIRSLIEQVRFQPQNGNYKVFIIDEVHMLSQAAFNAFLKTLEEPPSHAIFILATTEKHKILPTILSRCQLYDFRRISISDIIGQLDKIAKTENLEVEHDALYVIAEKADGAMRDALSLFDRISSATHGKVTYKAVVENLNLLDFSYYFRAVDAILEQDSSGCLILFNDVLANGFDGDVFMNGLAKHLRDLMYCKQEPTQKLMEISDQLKNKYLEQAQAISFSSILNFISLSNDCDLNFTKAKDKRLHCEITLLQMCYAAQMSSESGQDQQKKKFELKLTPSASPEGKKQSSRANEEKPQVISSMKNQAETQQASRVVETNAGQVGEASTTIKSVLMDTPELSSLDHLVSLADKELDHGQEIESISLDLEMINTFWKNYVLKVESPTTRAVLELVKIEISGSDIDLFVPSTISKEEIQQESELYELLRAEFKRPDLEIRITIDRARFPESSIPKQHKLLSSKEKYDHLKDKNILIDKLIDSLGLKLDQD